MTTTEQTDAEGGYLVPGHFVKVLVSQQTATNFLTAKLEASGAAENIRQTVKRNRTWHYRLRYRFWAWLGDKVLRLK